MDAKDFFQILLLLWAALQQLDSAASIGEKISGTLRKILASLGAFRSKGRAVRDAEVLAYLDEIHELLQKLLAVKQRRAEIDERSGQLLARIAVGQSKLEKRVQELTAALVKLTNVLESGIGIVRQALVAADELTNLLEQQTGNRPPNIVTRIEDIRRLLRGDEGEEGEEADA